MKASAAAVVAIALMPGFVAVSEAQDANPAPAVLLHELEGDVAALRVDHDVSGDLGDRRRDHGELARAEAEWRRDLATRPPSRDDVRLVGDVNPLILSHGASRRSS